MSDKKMIADFGIFPQRAFQNPRPSVTMNIDKPIPLIVNQKSTNGENYGKTNSNNK